MRVIFAGPSLHGSTHPVPAGCELWPPAALGDLTRAVHKGARVIGLVDGRFETVAAVWHKEILWALEAGVAVYGAASMGALRAAELGSFGMRGVGVIHDAFARGELEADDEVAVQHGPAESGYLPLSVALVDIRATLEAASSSGVTSAATATALLQGARKLFYKERVWEAIVAAAAVTAPVTELQRFQAWLPSGCVNRKRVDAEMLVEHVGQHQEGMGSGPPFQAERPRLVTELLRDLDRAPAGVSAALLDRLRLEPGAYAKRARRALLALLAAAELERRGAGVDPDDAVARYRDLHGLRRAEDFRAWLLARGLDRRRLEARLSLEAAVDHLLELCRAEVDNAVLDALQGEAAFPALLDAARAYAESAEAVGREDHGGLSLAALMAAYCRRHDLALPETPGDLAHELGFPSAEAFYGALRAWGSVREQSLG